METVVKRNIHQLLALVHDAEQIPSFYTGSNIQVLQTTGVSRYEPVCLLAQFDFI